MSVAELQTSRNDAVITELLCCHRSGTGNQLFLLSVTQAEEEKKMTGREWKRGANEEREAKPTRERRVA